MSQGAGTHLSPADGQEHQQRRWGRCRGDAESADRWRHGPHQGLASIFVRSLLCLFTLSSLGLGAWVLGRSEGCLVSGPTNRGVVGCSGKYPIGRPQNDGARLSEIAQGTGGNTNIFVHYGQAKP